MVGQVAWLREYDCELYKGEGKTITFYKGACQKWGRQGIYGAARKGRGWPCVGVLGCVLTAQHLCLGLIATPKLTLAFNAELKPTCKCLGLFAI